MTNTNPEDRLQVAIRELERQQTAQGRVLKDQINLVYESIKPANLIKSTIQEVAAMPDLKSNLLKISIGLLTGALARIWFKQEAGSLMKQLLRSALWAGINRLIHKYQSDSSFNSKK